MKFNFKSLWTTNSSDDFSLGIVEEQLNRDKQLLQAVKQSADVLFTLSKGESPTQEQLANMMDSVEALCDSLGIEVKAKQLWKILALTSQCYNFREQLKQALLDIFSVVRELL